jgi:hypothetical protein
MKINPVYVWLTILLAALTAVVSYAGAFVESTYAQEAINWAEQGIGQDYINLFVVAPLLVLTVIMAHKGSLRAHMVWLGLLLYLIYSYILYAFFIHFGPWFLAYVVILGLSSYLFVFGVIVPDRGTVEEKMASVKVRPISIWLMIIAVIFIALWLSDIGRNLAAGTIPEEIEQIGLPVNPIHVLDLALLLPGTLITAWLLLRRRLAGLVLAVPLMVFFAVMGIAIIAMAVKTAHGNFQSILPVLVMMMIIVSLNIVFVYRFLKQAE